MQLLSPRCGHVSVKQSIPIRWLVLPKYRKGPIWRTDPFALLESSKEAVVSQSDFKPWNYDGFSRFLTAQKVCVCDEI